MWSDSVTIWSISIKLLSWTHLMKIFHLQSIFWPWPTFPGHSGQTLTNFTMWSDSVIIGSFSIKTSDENVSHALQIWTLWFNSSTILSISLYSNEMVVQWYTEADLWGGHMWYEMLLFIKYPLEFTIIINFWNWENFLWIDWILMYNTGCPVFPQILDLPLAYIVFGEPRVTLHWCYSIIDGL
jgi:hypothetical protein